MGTVCILELDRVMVEDFAVVRPNAGFGAAHSVGANRVALFKPVNDIEVMDMLFDNMVAAEPNEVIPVAHLIFHFSERTAILLLELFARFDPRRGAIPIGAHRNDIADGALMQAL